MENYMILEKQLEYHGVNIVEMQHPSVSVIHFPTSAKQRSPLPADRYCIHLHDKNLEGKTLTFVPPSNINDGKRNRIPLQMPNHVLLFHPDFIRGTSIENIVRKPGLFDCQRPATLQLSENECQFIFDCFSKIELELQHPLDQHGRKYISSLIELLLNYCGRFYHSASTTNYPINSEVMEKFQCLLNCYFNSEKPETIGLPSVAYFAEKLNLSPNYFGDLIKKETGKTPRQYIQNKLIHVAKNQISGTQKSISEIAYDLGFKYPQHFMRLFKNLVGYTPNEYRNVLNYLATY